MLRRLSWILLTILLIFNLSSQPTYAAGNQQNNSSFFSYLENSLLVFINHNKQVLADQAQAILSPTLIPTLIPTIQPTQVPLQQSPQLSDVSSYILNGVNQYRASLGLSSVVASTETCAFAQTRAQEISNRFTHDGFYSRVNSHTLPYANWSHATENIAEAPDYKEVVDLWKNSPEHAANMRDNTPYVCIEQYGNYYAYEGMRL
jgi:uncharacterized protein YkwD